MPVHVLYAVCGVKFKISIEMRLIYLRVVSILIFFSTPVLLARLIPWQFHSTEIHAAQQF